MLEDISAENILRVYASASESERSEGLAWYSTAHTFAIGLAERYSVGLEQACGVVAALSPQVSWAINMVAADELCRTGKASRVLPDNKAKAARILSGEAIADVLRCPKCARGEGKHACSGDKVRNFFACILDPTDTAAVCVDRHAFDVAAGKVGDDKTRKVLDRRGAYETVANAYREAAMVVGLSAAALQAITWVAWRNAK